MTPFTTSTTNLGRIATITLIALSTFSATGCQHNRCGSIYNECIESCLSKHRAKARATQAWDCSQHCNLGPHVRSGFIDGYCDVALGRRGCTPAVAPSRYWGWRYPDGLGQQAGAQWLHGYPMGAMSAKGDGLNYKVATLDVTPRPGIQQVAPLALEPQLQLPATPGPDTIDGTIEFEPRDLPVDLEAPLESAAEDAASIDRQMESTVSRVNSQLEEFDPEHNVLDSTASILNEASSFEAPPVEPTTEFTLEQNNNQFGSWLK